MSGPSVNCGKEFSDWTAGAVEEQCADAYEGFKGELHERHLDYFEARPKSRNTTQPWAASERRFAFPKGWEHLADLLPEHTWLRLHLFGGFKPSARAHAARRSYAGRPDA